MSTFVESMVPAVDSSQSYRETLVKDLQDDIPTIYVSVKNLIALLLGKGFYGPNIEPSVHLTPSIAMNAAKYLLEAIRTQPLLSVEEYCTQHPQQQDQLGVDRLDEISKYRVVSELSEKVLQKGGKISRLFGRRYFIWSKSWSRIRPLVVSLCEKNCPTITEDELNLFLDTYEKSLEADANSIEFRLIWAKDFSEELQNMQRDRKDRVDTRNREIVELVEETVELDTNESTL